MISPIKREDGLPLVRSLVAKKRSSRRSLLQKKFPKNKERRLHERFVERGGAVNREVQGKHGTADRFITGPTTTISKVDGKGSLALRRL